MLTEGDCCAKVFGASRRMHSSIDIRTRILCRCASLVLRCLVLPISLIGEAIADDVLTTASLSFSSRSPAKNSVDLLIETATTVFDENDNESKLAGQDGYRMRLTFDDDGRIVGRETVKVWTGSGLFGHAMLNGNYVDTYVHVGDDGSMRRFLRKSKSDFTWQEFDEKSKTWGQESAKQSVPRVFGRNLRTEGHRWECIEHDKSPVGVDIYNLDLLTSIKDDWLERTIKTNLRRASFTLGNGIRVSNEKNFVVLEQSLDEYEEFELFGRGMTGSTSFKAPQGTYVRAVSESEDGRAAIIFSLEPDTVYAHEIDPHTVERSFNLKDLKQVRSKSLRDAGYDVWYHADAHSIVGVDTDFDVVTPSRTLTFKANARIVRWNLKTGEVVETTVPVGEQFHIVDRHVVPKVPVR